VDSSLRSILKHLFIGQFGAGPAELNIEEILSTVIISHLKVKMIQKIKKRKKQKTFFEKLTQALEMLRRDIHRMYG
jgi:hypothetical protein